MNRSIYLNVLKILCRIFWGPEISLCQDIISGEFAKLFQDSAVFFKTVPSAAIQAVDCFAAEYQNAEALHVDLSDGYMALFVNDIKGISAPLYHSCYQTSNSRMMGTPAIDMNNRLKRHGLSISLPGNEPADHLCIELEYVYYLLLKGWSEFNSELIREAVHFCEESMVDCVCRFCERVTADGRFVFYTAAAELLRVTVQSLSEKTIFPEYMPRIELPEI